MNALGWCGNSGKWLDLIGDWTTDRAHFTELWLVNQNLKSELIYIWISEKNISPVRWFICLFVYYDIVK